MLASLSSFYENIRSYSRTGSKAGDKRRRKRYIVLFPMLICTEMASSRPEMAFKTESISVLTLSFNMTVIVFKIKLTRINPKISFLHSNFLAYLLIRV